MPAKSRKQQRYLEVNFGHDWVKAHHFDRLKSAKKTTKRQKKRKRR